MSAKGKNVPKAVVERLPLYLRLLNFMLAGGKKIVSSMEMAGKLDFNAAQIRKDLSHFGEFGKQGTGYETEYLRDHLRRILKVEREWPIMVVGCGDLGQAIINYGGFQGRGFCISAALDNDPAKIGQPIGQGICELEIEHISEAPRIVEEQGLKIAILAVPPAVAQEVADMLIALGIKCILNYAPITISVPESVQVQYIDPVIHLQSMTYYLDV